VHASNAARLEQSYHDIADRVNISGRLDLHANIFKLVHNWLRDSNAPWLLVLDNMDDARFLFDVPANGQGQPANDSRTASKPLCEYLPHCERGSMLITTRNKEAALKLVEQRDMITVEPMNEAQALALFEKKLGTQGDSSQVVKLAAVLEYMPLAIVQAAAYVLQRAPRCSVRQYLTKFKKSERKRTSLLNRGEGQLRRDREAKNAIIVTWQISFEHIRQIRPSAADLLSLMSLFDRQGIPQTLLQSRTEQGDSQRGQRGRGDDDLGSRGDDKASQSSANEDEFEDDVLTLRNFCFISVDTDGTSFEMHALVQLATRTWLDTNGKLERWKQQFVTNLCAEFPTGEYENWAACKRLFAHAKSAAGQQPEGDASLAQWATLLYRAAWYAWRMGNVTDAERLAVKSMKARRRILGQDHEDTLRSMRMVVFAYQIGGQWDAAEVLGVQILETRKKKFGSDHLDTLSSMQNLALTYRMQGRWDAAKELEVHVLKVRKKKLGADHLDTLLSMGNMASTYGNRGRWDAAEELEVHVLETRKKKLGADHPDTLIGMANLASTYGNQGRWDAAEELEVQVLENRKKKLGADHPNTLIGMANLASTYANQGRLDAAEELQVQVLETRKKKLGADHPSTLIGMNNLSFTWKAQGRDAEALCLLRECVQRLRRTFRVDHPQLKTSSTTLARWEAAGAG
jgi:tetratricopeptide (TPR) repeat protein